VNVWDTQKSGLEIRGGVANNGDMLRLDVFEKGGKFFAVPVYVHAAAQGSLPDRAAVQAKPESEWPVMDETYRFLFCLHANDWVCLVKKDATYIEGYYTGFDRASATISVTSHDRYPNPEAPDGSGKALYADLPVGGIWRGVGIKTAAKFERFEVDLLGRVFPARTGGPRPPVPAR